MLREEPDEVLASQARNASSTSVTWRALGWQCHGRNCGKPAVQKPEDRLEIARCQSGKRWFARKEYLAVHKDISTATGSLDLAQGVEAGLLSVEREKATTRYRFNMR